MPADCELLSATDTTESCTLDLTCADGTQGARPSANCRYRYDEATEQFLTDSFECHCYSSTMTQALQLDGATMSSACAWIMGLCTGETEPDYQEPVCERTLDDDEDTYCRTRRDCVQAASVQPGATVNRLTYHTVNCTHSAEDNWACNCSDYDGTLRNTLPLDEPSPCETVDALCDVGTAAFVPEGSPSCEPDTELIQSYYCTLRYDCTQPGTLGDASFWVALGREVTCTMAEEGSWNCSCNGGTDESHSFQVTATDTSELACGQADTQCAEYWDASDR